MSPSRSACSRWSTSSRGRRAVPTRELIAGPEAAGERLDVFLAAEAGSRAAAQKLIEAGHVTVDGAVRPKRHVLAGGERIAIDAPPAAEPAEKPAAEFRIAYED